MFELLHLHIPKTAGSSLLELYKLHYGEDAVVSIKRKLFKNNPGDEKQLLIQEQLKTSSKILHGHFTWREVLPLISDEQNIKIVTFLRDPVERVISNYYFFKQRIMSGRVPENQKDRNSESLIDYAALPECRNRMSKFLDGLELEQLYFCGMMESFSTDVRRLFKLLGKTLDEIPDINKNDHFLDERKKITNDERNLIAELNSEDGALYERALQFRDDQIRNKV